MRQTMRSAYDQKLRDEEHRILVTERRLGPLVVRTCGYAIYVECLASTHHPYGQPLYRSTAEWLAETLLDRDKFIDGLTSPYKTKLPALERTV